MRRTGDRRLRDQARLLARRITGWLGADGNPLRRPSDRVEAVARVLLVLAFLLGGPVLAGSVGAQVGASGTHEVQAERSWRQVDAVVLRRAPRPYYPDGSTSTFWVPGRWHAPSGAQRTGMVPVLAGTPAGTRIPIWVDRTGHIAGHGPLTGGLVTLRVVVTEIVTLAGLALGLVVVAAMVRWQLDRRRMARWAIEWALVGPRWSARR